MLVDDQNPKAMVCGLLPGHIFVTTGVAGGGARTVISKFAYNSIAFSLTDWHAYVPVHPLHCPVRRLQACLTRPLRKIGIWAWCVRHTLDRRHAHVQRALCQVLATELSRCMLGHTAEASLFEVSTQRSRRIGGHHHGLALS